MVQAPPVLAFECNQFFEPRHKSVAYAVRQRRTLARTMFAVVVVSHLASQTFTRNIAELFVALRASRLGFVRSKPGRLRPDDSDRFASMFDAVSCQLSLASAKMSFEKLFCAI